MAVVKLKRVDEIEAYAGPRAIAGIRMRSAAPVGPNQKRKIVPGSEGARVLALGATPGKAYEPRR